MAPLFRSGRAAAERAAQAEVARLRALAAADLAAELMEAFGEGGAGGGLLGRNVTPLAVTEWLLRDHPRPAARHLRELQPASRRPAAARGGGAGRARRLTDGLRRRA